MKNKFKVGDIYLVKGYFQGEGDLHYFIKITSITEMYFNVKVILNINNNKTVERIVGFTNHSWIYDNAININDLTNDLISVESIKLLYG